MTTCVQVLNDLQAVTHALVDNDKSFELVVGTNVASVFGSFVSARFERNSSGSWSLVRAVYDGRPVNLTGLIDNIEGA